GHAEHTRRPAQPGGAGRRTRAPRASARPRPTAARPRRTRSWRRRTAPSTGPSAPAGIAWPADAGSAGDDGPEPPTRDLAARVRVTGVDPDRDRPVGGPLSPAEAACT